MRAFKNKTGKRQVLEVEWYDHASCGGWRDFDEIPKTALLCRSVGYRMYEDSKMLILSTTMAETKRSTDHMGIVKSCIIKRRRIA